MAAHRGSFTDAELVSRLLLLEQYKGVQAEAARALGVARSSFSASVSEAKRRKLTAQSKVMNETDKWKTKAKMLEQQLASVHRINIEAEAIRQEIFNLASETPDPPKWVLRYNKPKSSGIPMFHWSDWHHGELVKVGPHKFNRAIGKARVERLVHTSIDLACNHMTRPDYPGAVICLNGDMITGAIHEELRETNDGSVQESILDVEEMLIWALENMARKFGKLLVVCTVGNHARGTPKPRFKFHVVMSYEWNIYQHLERHFARDRRINFVIPRESDALFNVVGHRFLQTHGDMLGVKGGDGIIGSLGPITRGAIKVGRQKARMGHDFDTLIMGHWHNYLPRGRANRITVNGALKGFDEYAAYGLRAEPAPASQSLWFCHPKYGVTAQWEVLLEGEKKAAEAPWVSWQQKEAA